MAEPLYALKRDLDMMTLEIENLKNSYNLLDYIVKAVRDVQIEQIVQSERIRRMEERLDRVEERLDRVEERLDRVEERLDRVEERLDRVEEKLDKIEKMLSLIIKHLGITPA